MNLCNDILLSMRCLDFIGRLDPTALPQTHLSVNQLCKRRKVRRMTRLSKIRDDEAQFTSNTSSSEPQTISISTFGMGRKMRKSLCLSELFEHPAQ